MYLVDIDTQLDVEVEFVYHHRMSHLITKHVSFSLDLAQSLKHRILLMNHVKVYTNYALNE